MTVYIGFSMPVIIIVVFVVHEILSFSSIIPSVIFMISTVESFLLVGVPVIVTIPLTAIVIRPIMVVMMVVV